MNASKSSPSPSSSVDASEIEADEYDDQLELAAELAPIRLDLTASDAGERLDKVLARLVPAYSRSRMQQWIDAGLVKVDGESARSKATVFGDEHIEIQPQHAPDEQAFAPEPIALDVVHEDAALIVLDKPAGLVVHPAAGNWSGTLLNGLLHRWPTLGSVPRAGIVHRLDKETSGLMAVAKTLTAQTDLVRQLQARTVRRQYLALVWGTPQLSGSVDAPMARHPRDRIKMAVSSSVIAKNAITHYRRIATGAIDAKPVSLVHCRLETGRTHQIRVHMQSIGHPLVGDQLYGKTHLAAIFGRQALHAWHLGLEHPSSGKSMQWEAPLPGDFADLLTRAGILQWSVTV